jgi:hypothetical protein
MTARNLVGGLVVALVLAAPFVVPAVAGISTWKILLGVMGLWVFVGAGLSRSA